MNENKTKSWYKWDRFKLIIAALLCIYIAPFVLSSYLAPTGNWFNIVLNISRSGEHDPGGPYLFSSVDLRDYEKARYIAGSHPGLTLQYYLNGVLTIGHKLAGGSDDSSLQEFIAANLAKSFFWAKISMILMHLLSFYLLFVFASKLFEREVAMWGVVLYATSLPVMFYLTRISPEPLIVIIFLSINILFQKIYFQSINLKSFQGVATVIALALLAVAGIYTKIHLLAATPLIVLAFVLFVCWQNRHQPGVSNYALWALPLILIITGAMAFMWFTSKLDWNEFFVFWRGVLEGDYYARVATKEAFDPVKFFQTNIPEMVSDYFVHIKTFFTKQLFYHFRANNNSSLYTLTEWQLCILAGVGAWYYFRKNTRQDDCGVKKAFFIWPGMFLMFSFSVYVIKPRMNYLFIAQTLVALFASYGIHRMMEKYLLPESIKRKLVLTVAVIFVHFTAAYALINCRFEDIKSYRMQCRPYYEALARLNGEEKLGIVYSDADPEGNLPIILSFGYIDHETKFIQTLKAKYIVLNKQEILSTDKAENTNYFFKNNNIKFIIEAQGNGLPTGGYIDAGRWLERNSSAINRRSAAVA